MIGVAEFGWKFCGLVTGFDCGKRVDLSGHCNNGILQCVEKKACTVEKDRKRCDNRYYAELELDIHGDNALHGPCRRSIHHNERVSFCAFWSVVH